MAVRMTKTGWIAKWVVVPGILALLGYFVIGPSLGKVTGTTPKSAQSKGDEPPNADPPAKAGATADESKKPGLDVTVDVRKVKPDSTSVADDAPRPRRKKRQKTEGKPSEPDPGTSPQKPLAKPHPTNDEGGSAGSTTAG